jgi:hypothetical protein
MPHGIEFASRDVWELHETAAIRDPPRTMRSVGAGLRPAENLSDVRPANAVWRRAPL